MTGSNSFRGLYAAVATPINRNGQPDVDRILDHCLWLRSHGVNGVCPFGTTGEGVSFSIGERIDTLTSIVETVAPDRVLPVVGACSVDDAAALVESAASLCCAAALLLPPYYFKQPTDDGLFAFYSGVIDRVSDSRLRLFVYNIPQVTSIAITHGLVDRLCARYGATIAGIKDSCGNVETTVSYCRRFPSLSVFTGTDAHIVPVMRAGGAGTVTGMGNINPTALRHLVDHYDDVEAVDRGRQAGKLHQIVENYGGVPAMKAVIARYRNDATWADTAPPLVRVTRAQTDSIIAELEQAGHSWPS